MQVLPMQKFLFFPAGPTFVKKKHVYIFLCALTNDNMYDEIKKYGLQFIFNIK